MYLHVHVGVVYFIRMCVCVWLYSRIIQHENGTVQLFNSRQGEEAESSVTFDSLQELVEGHRRLRAGLPTLLTSNCSPNVTGHTPLLLPELDDSSGELWHPDCQSRGLV